MEMEFGHTMQTTSMQWMNLLVVVRALLTTLGEWPRNMDHLSHHH